MKVKKIVGATKFQVYLGNPAESQPIEIQIDGNTFYRIELGKRLKIGDFKEAIRLLYKCDAKLAYMKGNRFRPYQLFFSRNEALKLMREGYPALSMETMSILVFDDQYTRVISSDGIFYEEGSLPCGRYCLALNEQRLSRTYDEVQAIKDKEMKAEQKKLAEEAKEKRQMETEIERNVRRRIIEEERQAKTAAREQEIACNQAVSEPEPEKNNSTNELYYKIAGAFGILLTGIGLGMFMDKKLN